MTPCKIAYSLVGKAYVAAGQAGACLHTIAILQAYQDDLLKDLDEGNGVGPDIVKELHWVTDFPLRSTKKMAALVATERHLWLNLSGIKEKEKSFLLNGSFLCLVQEAKKQFINFHKFIPRRTQVPGAATKRPPQPSQSPLTGNNRSRVSLLKPPITETWGRDGTLNQSLLRVGQI